MRNGSTVLPNESSHKADNKADDKSYEKGHHCRFIYLVERLLLNPYLNAAIATGSK